MGYCWSESSPGCKIKIHIDMITQYETWNGYAVHGDVKELDAIVESTGFIELDKEDVVSILSADGENCVISGTAMRWMRLLTMLSIVCLPLSTK